MQKKESNEGGENIRRLRESMGFTQHELSESLGLCNRSVICRYERGTLKPSIQTCYKLIKLASKYNYIVTLDYLRPS